MPRKGAEEVFETTCLIIAPRTHTTAKSVFEFVIVSFHSDAECGRRRLSLSNQPQRRSAVYGLDTNILSIF